MRIAWTMILLAACATTQGQPPGLQPANDVDGDGIRDVVDKCAYDPGPEPDGCPLAKKPEDKASTIDVTQTPNTPLPPKGNPGDRDADGIPDASDKCPDQPEDMDSFADADGCPDPDNDQDGLVDAKDKCPNEPEDKDSFEDEDGCPDPDNDKDKILDMNDRCPNEPETMNGRTDTDGCPD
jgi:hypothetical protein